MTAGPRPPAGRTPPRLRSRKTPQQARSRQTRERILAAAARVFAEHGYAAGTTNRVAAEAALSVGSLYQYFPNKDAILVELMRAHIADGAAVIERLVRGEALHGTLEERLAVLVTATIDIHSGDPRLHRVLFEEAPRPPELLNELRALERSAIDAAERALCDDPELGLAAPRAAAWFVVATIESLTHRYLASPHAELDREAFQRELVTLLARYLRG